MALEHNVWKIKRLERNIWKETSKANKYSVYVKYRKTGENTESTLLYHGDIL